MFITLVVEMSDVVDEEDDGIEMKSIEVDKKGRRCTLEKTMILLRFCSSGV